MNNLTFADFPEWFHVVTIILTIVGLVIAGWILWDLEGAEKK